MGSDFMKVALVAPGKPLEIVLNLHSKRKTPSAVSFADKRRAFGDDALTHAVRAAPRVFHQMNDLLGFNASAVASRGDLSISRPPIDLFPYAYGLDSDRGTVTVEVDEINMYPEEILAHIFTHIRHLVKQHHSITASHCAITVPGWFRSRQRQAIRDAASIAQMEVVALAHGTAAAALHHALDLTFADANAESSNNSTAVENNSTSTVKPSSKTPIPRPPLLKLIINSGSSSTEACAVRYYGTPATHGKQQIVVPGVRVLGCSSSSLLSGSSVDRALVRLMARHFVGGQTGPGTATELTPRALKKLLQQAVKAKFVLSANKEANIFVESVTPNRDLKFKISRAHLEQELAEGIRSGYAAEGLSEEGVIRTVAEEVVTDALRIANLTSIAEVDAVEVVGGAWRVPIFQSALETLLPDSSKLGQRMNGDEAMAMGCGYIAANYSNAFRVKKIYFDTPSVSKFSVDIRPLLAADDEITPNEDDSVTVVPSKNGLRSVVIAPHARLGGGKSVSFPATHNVQVSLFEDDALLSTYNVTGIKDVYSKMQTHRGALLEKFATLEAWQVAGPLPEIHVPKARLLFSVSQLGLVDLTAASVNYKQSYLTPVASNTTTPSPAPSNSTLAEDEHKNATATSDDSPPAAETNDTATEQTLPRVPAAVTAMNLTEKTHTATLEISSPSYGAPLPLSAEHLSKARIRLQAYEKRDRHLAEQEDARNRLETLGYVIRDRLTEESVKKVSLEEERAAVSESVSEIEEWLYGDGFSARSDELQDRTRALEDQWRPLAMRAMELEARPSVIMAFQSSMDETKAAVEKLKLKMPWLQDSDTAPVKEVIKDAESWFNEKLSAQAKLTPLDPPAFTTSSSRAQLDTVTAALQRLAAVKKPKPPPKAKNSTTVAEPHDSPSETKVNVTLTEDTPTAAGATEDPADSAEAEKPDEAEQPDMRGEEL